MLIFRWWAPCACVFSRRVRGIWAGHTPYGGEPKAQISAQHFPFLHMTHYARTTSSHPRCNHPLTIPQQSADNPLTILQRPTMQPQCNLVESSIRPPLTPTSTPYNPECSCTFGKSLFSNLHQHSGERSFC